MPLQAGSAYSLYRLDLSFLDRDIADAKRRLADLQQTAARPVPLGTGAGASASGSALPQQAADAELRLAQQRARLAQITQGNAAAEQVLTTALQNTTGASERATLSVQTQVARLQSGTSAAQTFGDAFKNGLLGIIGPAAAAGVALAAVRGAVESFVEAFKFRAELEQQQTAIGIQLRGLRDSGQVFQEASAFAQKYGFTQQEVTQAITDSLPVVRRSQSSMEDILGVFSRLIVLKPDKTFNDAARALSELQSGQATSLNRLFNVPLRDANAMKHEIEGGADAVQVLSKYLSGVGIGMDALEARTKGAMGAMHELARAEEELKLAQADFAQGPGLTILQGRIQATRGVTRLLSGDFDDARQSITNAANAGSFGFKLFDFIANGALANIARSQNQANAATAAAAATTQQQTQAVTANTSASALNAAAMASRAQFTQAATEAIHVDLTAIDDDTQKSMLDAVAAQTLGVQKAYLTQQAQLAASALIVSGNAGAQTAARLASSASLVDVLTAAYLRLRAAQAAALQQDLNRLNVPGTLGRGTLGPETEVREFNRSVKNDDLEREQAVYRANAKAVADAKRDQVLAVGSNNAKIKQLESDLAEAERRYGADSAQAIRAQTALEQEQDKQRQARGHAHAGAKLTDQQKLNNQLLADEERYENKIEDIEDEHYKNLLKIQQDYDKRSLEEQHRNEIAKRQSRADFYDNLTSSTKTLGQKEAQALSAQYEEAYAKAQQIAQSGQQKLAHDYLELRQRQLQEETEYQKNLAEARKNKDQAEIERLQQIHKLRQEANAEEEKQLLEGGDQNQNQRKEQETAENTRYQEQVDKATTAAERSSDAKVGAARRAGKAVADENIELQRQADLYDRIGTRVGAAPPSTPSTANSPGAAPPPSTAGASAGQGEAGAAGIARVFDSAVVEAINAQTSTLMGGLAAVQKAVENLGPRVDRVETAVRNSRRAVQ